LREGAEIRRRRCSRYGLGWTYPVHGGIAEGTASVQGWREVVAGTDDRRKWSSAAEERKTGRLPYASRIHKGEGD